MKRLEFKIESLFEILERMTVKGKSKFFLVNLEGVIEGTGWTLNSLVSFDEIVSKTGYIRNCTALFRQNLFATRLRSGLSANRTFY